MTLDQVIKREALSSMLLCDLRVADAAKSLGVAKTTLYRWLEKWDVETSGTSEIKRSELSRRKEAVRRMLES